VARLPSTTARRYAEAVFQIAQRDDTVGEWLEQLDRVAAALTEEQVVRRLEDPAVPFAERHGAFRALFKDEMLEPLYSLLGIVLRRRRLELLPGIAREYRALYDRNAGIVEATATSAAELDQREVTALRERLEKITGARVELRLAVDPALLGGVQVRMGDQLLDGSVRGRLERLRERIASGSYS
jgi:F-type H+-transporting ATPase subunit delta